MKAKIGIGGDTYSIGLAWQIVASQDDIVARIEETGRGWGVILKSPGKGRGVVGIGFSDDEGRGIPPSAAATLALLNPGQAVCAIERVNADGRHDGQHWMAAVSGGAVVAGTDTLFEDDNLLRRHVQDLVRDFGCKVTGADSEKFGGDGVPAFHFDGKKKPSAASIRSLKQGVSPVQIVALAVLFAGIGWLAWTVLQPEKAAPPAPSVIDRQAEARKQAVAERNRLLSNDLSGFGPTRMAALARSASPPHGSQSAWRLETKRCTNNNGTYNCIYSWRALWKGATPESLATALGLERPQVSTDAKADVAIITGPLMDGHEAPPRVEAVESTVLNGNLPILIDLCRRYVGAGGACSVEAGQPVTIPNANLLPAGLAYRRGRLVLSGRLGEIDSLLPLFGGEKLSPWVLADSYAFDYGKSEFRIEGHYVLS
jgi:hypothetical protein